MSRFQQAIVEMCEKRPPQEGAPSLVCPGCLEESGTSDTMVAFDCGHAACLSCVTHSLRILRDSPDSNHTVQPLACFLGKDSCNGVLFCAQTRAVLRRISRPAASTAAAPATEPPPPPEEDAAAPRTPDSDTAAADADTPPPAARPDSAALDADAAG